MPDPAKSTAVVIKRVVAVAVVVLLMLAAAVAADYWRSALPPDTVATYVGRASCVDCHQAEAAAFQGSHHDLAMDHANSQTVLGDFNDVTFEHHGIISRMYRDGDRYMIYTEGPDGKMADFEVEYVFGVEPLQQYMVEFDRDEKTPADALARLQVLRISWDTVRGRWFYLAPPDVEEKLAPDDDLHWTGIAQRWNTMCAECHSTDLQRNYDPQTQRYATTYSEIDVSCEACHGPGSTHVQLANSRSLFWDRNLGFGLAPLKGDDAELQIQACAPCHSRRGILAGGFQAGDAYCDFYEPSPLRQMLYHDDGQILDEVYVHGSFVQSKMYHKGIRCSDCHDPHSLKLKAPGNQVCTSCHQHPAGKYDTPSHHKHAPGKPGSACVDCHMPETTYMAVDPRRDHSLRIPRPDLSVSLGTPNACTGCHLDSANVAAELRDGLVDYAAWQLAAKQEPQIAAEISRVDAWCDQACDQWYGATRNREPHYAEALHAFRSGDKEGVQRLAELAAAAKSMPAIARATALDELADLPDLSQLATSTRAARQSLEDPSPMVRAAAIRALATERYRQDGQSRLAGTLGPSLADPSRLVRTTAARTLASTGAFRSLTPALEKKFESAIDEVKAGISQVADRAAAHLDWALLCESLGRVKEAVDAYKIAMQVEPRMVGPRSNLAGLLDNLLNARQQSGQLSPQEAAATRETIANLRRQELPMIERDAKLAPDNAVLQYRLGMAYYLVGRMEEALASLQRSCQLAPENEDFATAVRLLKEKLDDL